MIKTAVYTYWDNEENPTNSGFRTPHELARAITLSIAFTKKQFDRIKLVTNAFGEKVLIDHYNLPFDEVSTAMDGIDIPNEFWSLSKIFSYSLQTEPFIHIDNDVFLLEPIPEEKLKADILFQNREDFGVFAQYPHALKLLNDFKVDLPGYILNSKVDYAVNCGIVACNDVNVTKEWLDLATSYITDDSSQAYLVECGKLKENIHNYVMEQMFIPRLMAHKGMKDGVLIDDFNVNEIDKPSFKIAHLWGGIKRQQEYNDQIYKLLNQSKDEYRFILGRTRPDSPVFKS